MHIIALMEHKTFYASLNARLAQGIIVIIASKNQAKASSQKPHFAQRVTLEVGAMHRMRALAVIYGSLLFNANNCDGRLLLCARSWVIFIAFHSRPAQLYDVRSAPATIHGEWQLADESQNTTERTYEMMEHFISLFHIISRSQCTSHFTLNYHRHYVQRTRAQSQQIKNQQNISHRFAETQSFGVVNAIVCHIILVVSVRLDESVWTFQWETY